MRSRFGRLDIAVNNAGTEGLRRLVIENALAERGGGASNCVDERGAGVRRVRDSARLSPFRPIH
jgi:hypothetical protein